MLVVTMAVLFGCETSFNPVTDDTRQYSVLGFLNASADTQFVRIEKLQDGQFTNAPVEFGVDVRLKNVNTGVTVSMQDSLFYYLGGTSSAHNFYTTADIEHTQSYQLEIGEGTTTSGRVDIPADFPEPEITDSLRLVREVEISGIDRLILANVVYHITTKCLQDFTVDCVPMQNQITFSYLQDTVQAPNGNTRAEIQLGSDLLEIEEAYPPIQGERAYTVNRVDLIVAAGSDDWPDFLSLNEESVAVPGTISNIEGGVGFLGGTVTDTLILINSEDELDW